MSNSTDPVALLDFAWAMEPALRLSERYGALDRLEELILSGDAPPAPAGRDWRIELMAERAYDAASNVRLAEGRELAERVLAEASPDLEIALARATLARARALAWLGTREGTRQADMALEEAVERFRRLGNREWEGFARFWQGHAIHFENGELRPAVQRFVESLEIIGPDSPRRSTILTFYAEALVDLGDLELGDATLDEAAEVAERDDDQKSRSYVAWTRSHITSARDDAEQTLALLRETEALADDWFSGHAGVDFLADCADQLDRVGLTELAYSYLRRADEQFRTHIARPDGPDYDESIMSSEATLLARSGDPHKALDRLAELFRADWLERRLLWRYSMLTAWAHLRAGDRVHAGEIAARGLAEAVTAGGIGVAIAGEGTVTRALAPLAEEAGSEPARQLLTDGGRALIRLFGSPSLHLPDGTAAALPGGMPGTLIRWLALAPAGVQTSAVLSEFYPEVDTDTARGRLRQVLKRIRSEVGDLVLRDGERLTLAPAWVDVRAFREQAAAGVGATGGRRIELAWSALSLARRGPLLVTDPYASWADAAREEIEAITDRLEAVLA